MQIGIVLACPAPVSVKEMMQNLNIINRSYFRKKHLKPLLEQGIVLMEYPDIPKHPEQRYYLSKLGKEVLQALQLR